MQFLHGSSTLFFRPFSLFCTLLRLRSFPFFCALLRPTTFAFGNCRYMYCNTCAQMARTRWLAEWPKCSTPLLQNTLRYSPIALFFPKCRSLPRHSPSKSAIALSNFLLKRNEAKQKTKQRVCLLEGIRAVGVPQL